MCLKNNLDAREHIEIGMAMQELRKEDVLIVGSGFSFHNFGYLFAKDPEKKERGKEYCNEFHQYLKDGLVKESIEERTICLQNWDQTPSGLEAHPPGG